MAWCTHDWHALKQKHAEYIQATTLTKQQKGMSVGWEHNTQGGNQ